MLELNKVQSYERIKGTMQVKLTKRNPYVRLKSAETIYVPGHPPRIKDNPPLFVQEGKIYAEGGEEILPEEAPEWFWKEAGKLNPLVREECGLKLRTENLQAMAEPILPRSLTETESTAMPVAQEVPVYAVPPKPERKYRCESCAVEMPLKRKGVHMAMHARKEMKDGNDNRE